ncbi:MAG: YciI family protein [Gemmatimonadetes bacterium]|nr:YciI family protein [Gemmatimonadota bacterium]
MRFLMMVKASAESEAGVLPDEATLAAMAKYNDELAKAGVMLDGSGLRPSSQGARVRFSSGKPRVIDGPFAETKELIAGYWLIQAKSLDEAIEWARRVPFDEGEIEIRPLYELDDFGDSPAVEHHREIGRRLAGGK